VADAEQRKQVLSGGVTNVEVPVLLQVQQLNDAAPCTNFKDQTVYTSKPGMSSRWEDIHQKLRIDEDLDELKRLLLWKMLERY
jgi:hypothetical protein